jgi:hypothetical protein
VDVDHDRLFERHADEVLAFLARGTGGRFTGAVRYPRGVPAARRPGTCFAAHTVVCAPGCMDVDTDGVLR